MNYSKPNILIVVPTLNEERYIERCLQSLINQDYNGKLLIAVYDGGSLDKTVEIVKSKFESEDIKLYHNTKKTQASAINMAAASDDDGDVIIRADAHSSYDFDFVSKCVNALIENRVVSVVVPLRTVGVTYFQRAVASAQNSILGNGGAAHRNKTSSGYIDHGHHAAFDRFFFVAIGGYDTDFIVNEDAELDKRIAATGGKIWMCSEASVLYYPRSTVKTLASQYRRYGFGRAMNVYKHNEIPKLRQLAPLAVFFSSIICSIFSLFYPIFIHFLIFLISFYQFWSIASSLRSRNTSYLGMGFAAAVMHFSWSLGFTEFFLKKILAKLSLSAIFIKKKSF